MKAPLLQIGVSKEAVKEARAAIIAILDNKNAENKTKIVALETLRTLCNVNGTQVTNCNFEGK